MYLGHRVMSPAIRTKPVGAREKIRLENWLQHQFDAGLGYPVSDRGNPQVADFAARFGDRALPRRQRLETAVFQRSPQLIQKPLDPTHDLDVAGGLSGEGNQIRIGPSTPAVREPVLPRTRSHATSTNAGSQTRLNRSSNRR
jgi:hypothetical protein